MASIKLCHEVTQVSHQIPSTSGEYCLRFSYRGRTESVTFAVIHYATSLSAKVISIYNSVTVV